MPSKKANEELFMALRGRHTLRTIQAILGLVLAVSGAITFYCSTIAVQEDDLASLSLMLVAELKFFSGLWLLWGSYPEETRPWTIAIFTGLWISDLLKALAGKCSSGCLGTFVVNPWFAVIFNLTALIVLLKWRPSDEQTDTFSVSSSQSIGLVLTSVLIIAAGFWSQPLVTTSGIATFDGRPLQDVSLAFVKDNAIEIEVRTTPEGFFRLPPVRPGLYTVSVSGNLPAQKPEPTPVNSHQKLSKQGSTRNAREKSPGHSTYPAQSANSTAKVRRLIDECAQEQLKVEF